ncbi:SseB family protein [Krasilnikovia sp. MM14-A1259]|uniref:SseB family protein n=1 Tax=Krasilnikovia sp. MM14-A1259 TaxID=3373539 RepID=UPI00399C5FF3
MSEWQPATDAEMAMRDALRTDDQESYFRILAGVDLLLPVSADALAGLAPLGWGTWSTGGRTHVLAFTSTSAMQACLADYTGSARRVPYLELANTWPNLEWWLAVNPGLPIEGYLPAWFVAQLARGDLRLPTRGPVREATRPGQQQLDMPAAAAAVNTPGQGGPLGSSEPGGFGGPGGGVAPYRAETESAPGAGFPADPEIPGAGGMPIRVPGTVLPSGLPSRVPGGQAATGVDPSSSTPAAYSLPSVPSEAQYTRPELPPLQDPHAPLPTRTPMAQTPPVPTHLSTGQPAGDLTTGASQPAISAGHGSGPVSAGSVPPGSVPPGPVPPGPASAGPASAGPASAGPASPGPASAGLIPAGPVLPGPASAGVVPPGSADPLPRRQPLTPAEPGGARPASPVQPGQAVPRPEVSGSRPPGAGQAGALTGARPGIVPPVIPGAVAGTGQPGDTRGVPGAAGDPSPYTGAPALMPTATTTASPAAEQIARPAAEQTGSPAAEQIASAGPSAGGGSEPVGGARLGDPSSTATAGYSASGSPSGGTATVTGRTSGDHPGGGIAQTVASRPAGDVPASGSDLSSAPGDDREKSRVSIGEALSPAPDALDAGRAAAGGEPANRLAADHRDAEDQPAPDRAADDQQSGREAAAGRLALDRPSEDSAPGSQTEEPTSRPPNSPTRTSYDRPSEDQTPYDRPSEDQTPYDRPSQDLPSYDQPSQEPAVEDHDTSVGDDDFIPANPVEQDLYIAAGSRSTDAFLSTLLLATVLVPVAGTSRPGSAPGESGFAFRTEDLSGEPYLVVFTSRDRLADYYAEPTRTVSVRFVELIRNWPDSAWSFAVNPGSPVGATYPGPQVIALANWAVESGLGFDPADEPLAPEEVPEPLPQRASDPAQHATVMQKTVSPHQVDYFLERGYDRVAGFVHRAGEVAHLRTPAELFAALGLIHDGSPHQADAKEAYVLRWPAYRPSLYRIPYGGQNEQALRAMDGWVIERAPFRGNGFAPGEGRDVIAEFKVDSVRLPHGAQLWRIDADGTQALVAVLDCDGPVWRQVGEQR